LNVTHVHAVFAIDSEKYLGYATCQACTICQTFCL